MDIDDVKDEVIAHMMEYLVAIDELSEDDFFMFYKYSKHNGLQESIKDIIGKYCKCAD